MHWNWLGGLLFGIACGACQSGAAVPPASAPGPSVPGPVPVAAASDEAPPDRAPPPRQNATGSADAVDEAAVVAFWKQAIAECNEYLVSTGNEPMMSFRRLTVLATLAVALALPFAASAPAAAAVIVVPPGERDPSRTLSVGARQPNGSVVVTDAAETQLWVDVSAKRITPVGGEAEAMPLAYAYCDPKTWVGTMHD